MVDQSEKEQIEEFRAWWNEYGNYVIAGVVIGALLLFGWNYYKSSKASAEIGASMLYDELTDHVAEDRVAEAERVMGDLEGTYPESIYAAQSRLAMARLYMDNNRDADAASVLRELVESKSSPTFAAVARLRLARVLLYQEKFDEVLALLDLEEAPGFAARYAEARGDALVALERFDEAREEYLVALADNGQTVDTAFLQLKILDLPQPTAGDTVAEDMADGDAIDMPETAGSDETGAGLPDSEVTPDVDVADMPEAAADEGAEASETLE